MVKVVKGARPDLSAVPRSRPPACTGFVTLMQRCWAHSADDRPSFQGTSDLSLPAHPKQIYACWLKLELMHPLQYCHHLLTSQSEIRVMFRMSNVYVYEQWLMLGW